MYQLIYIYICGAVEFEVFYSSQDTIILTLISINYLRSCQVYYLNTKYKNKISM